MFAIRDISRDIDRKDRIYKAFDPKAVTLVVLKHIDIIAPAGNS